MKTVDRIARIVAVLLLCVAWSDGQATDFAPPAADGWYSWQVEGEADLVRLFVKMKDGSVTRIRMKTHHCWGGDVPKEFEDLGQIDNSASIAWLKTQVAPRSNITEDALFALAAHDGDEVFEYFDQLISRSSK